jgi:hypothetical protein
LSGGLEDNSEEVRTKGLVGRRTKGRQEGTKTKLQGNVLKRNSMRFAAAFLIALASFAVGPNAALAAAAQLHDQAPVTARIETFATDQSHRHPTIDRAMTKEHSFVAGRLRNSVRLGNNGEKQCPKSLKTRSLSSQAAPRGLG